MKNLSHSRFVVWSLVVSIVIVLNLFFNYALSLVWKAPSYDAYMTRPQVVELYTRESCVAAGGQWTQTTITSETTDPQSKLGGYCDPDYTNRMRYEADRKVYNRNVFLVLVALGALVVGIGTALKKRFEVLAIAFSWAGVLSFVIASMRYWSDATDLWRVLILAIALVVLIYLAIKKFAQ